MVPPDEYGDQRVVGHSTDVLGAQGDCALNWERDTFGNRVARVRAQSVPLAIEFTVDYTVERLAGSNSKPLPKTADLGAYLSPTALTAPNDRLRNAAEELSAQADVAGVVEPAAREHALAKGASAWAARAIAYQLGVTGVQTPAAMALHLGRGVCQDYAHIAIALLRILGVPARYVSGHLLGEGAPHAWLEALLPDLERPGHRSAVPYDPTHSGRVGLNYITVAVGRDYADVAPTSGTFTGPSPGVFSTRKEASVVALDLGDGVASS